MSANAQCLLLLAACGVVVMGWVNYRSIRRSAESLATLLQPGLERGAEEQGREADDNAQDDNASRSSRH